MANGIKIALSHVSSGRSQCENMISTGVGPSTGGGIVTNEQRENTGIDGGITSHRYAEEMLTEVFIIYLMNAIEQVVMTSAQK